MISSIDGWYESVKADTVETITCTDYYPAPIWELFSEDAEDVLKEYFKKNIPITRMVHVLILSISRNGRTLVMTCSGFIH